MTRHSLLLAHRTAIGMWTRGALCVLSLFALGACQPEAGADDVPSGPAEPTGPTLAHLPEGLSFTTYGEALPAEGAWSVDWLVPKAADWLDREVHLAGETSAVCQSQGCWITLRTEEPALVRIDVARDEDGAYLFTVPSDITGRTVVVWGTLTTLELAPSANEEDENRTTEERTTEDSQDPDVPSLRLVARSILVADDV